jgi:hypothetical protein
MPFIFGFILGQIFSSKDGFLAILLMPFVTLLLFGLGYIGFYAGSWYEDGATATIANITWQPWTWNWPGVNLAHQFIDFLTESIRLATGSKLGLAGVDDIFGLNFLFKWLFNTIGAMVAISINLFVATIPFYVINFAKFAYSFAVEPVMMKAKAPKAN